MNIAKPMKQSNSIEFETVFETEFDRLETCSQIKERY